MSTYIINAKTYALISNNKGTKIIEDKKIINKKEYLNSILNYNCFIHGSSLEGREKGSSYLLKTSYKPPIILDESNIIILIPTHSKRNKLCTWLVLDKILNYYPTSNNRMIVEFINYTKIVINVSYNIFDKQYLKATKLESCIRSRNIKKYL